MTDPIYTKRSGSIDPLLHVPATLSTDKSRKHFRSCRCLRKYRRSCSCSRRNCTHSTAHTGGCNTPHRSRRSGRRDGRSRCNPCSGSNMRPRRSACHRYFHSTKRRSAHSRSRRARCRRDSARSRKRSARCRRRRNRRYADGNIRNRRGWNKADT